MSLLAFVKQFYARNVPVGDRLGETFYAVWMAVVSIGLINSVKQITPDVVWHTIGVAFSVNIAWGLIDGITAMYTGVIERARRDRLLFSLRSGDATAAARVAAAFDGTIVGDLDDAGKQRIVAALAEKAAGTDPALRRYGPDRDDLLYAFGIFVIDVALVVPIVLPLVLVSDVETAIYISRLVATVIFAALGWAYARRLDRDPRIAAVALGLLGFAVFTGAYASGW